MLQHIQHLEETFGVGPHTISMPRLEPAVGSDIASQPPHPVSDLDFRKIVAILRLAVPYTGMILSTREEPNLRRETFALGVSQISAGSRTNPGGYTDDTVADMEQFQLGDHRTLDEVIRDVAQWATCPRSAPPATAWAAPAPTSWTWPSPARSSTTATPTRSRRSRSTSKTTARPRPSPRANS